LSKNFNGKKPIVDHSFNLIQVTAPFLIKLTQFGSQRHLDTRINHMYYRPELGFGYGSISLGLNHTIMFNIDIQTASDKWMLSLGFRYPLQRKVNFKCGENK